MDLIEHLKIIRNKIAALTNLVDRLEATNEVSCAINKLTESKMELGRVLKELGSKSPYRHSKNPSNDIIINTQEREGTPAFDNENISRVRKVKAYRNRIDHLEKELKAIFELMDTENIWAKEHFKTAIIALIQSGMWLGNELGRVKEERDSYTVDI